MIHSYSAIKTWNVCPRQYYHKYVIKSVKYEPSPALQKGQRVHEALEAAVKGDNQALAREKLWTPDGLLDLLQRGQAQAEVKLAMRRDGTPCDFWDKTAWLRGAIDVELTTRRASLLLDWKTGKVYPDALQADMYVTMLRAKHGSNLKPTFYFVYVDQEVVISERPDTAAEERVRANIELVENDSHYHPRPCFACRWCPVTSCEYQGG
jgi:hypothetical protein